MSEIKGEVGKLALSFLSLPKSQRGSVFVRLDSSGGNVIEVKWSKDECGIWLELPHGVFGFDVQKYTLDDGKSTYRVTQRNSAQAWDALSFQKPGEAQVDAAASTQKKAIRVRAQMPGKIVRVLVAEGALVQKDQSLVVMEAMKMENEIRASHAGKVSKIKIISGQAVETGTDLMVIDVL